MLPLTVDNVRGFANKALPVADLVVQMTPWDADNKIVRGARKLIDSDPFLEVAVEVGNLVSDFLLSLWSGKAVNLSDEQLGAMKEKIIAARVESAAAIGSVGP